VQVPYADFTDPQTLNLYAYVRETPTSRIDQDGHEDGIWDTLKQWFQHLIQPGMDVHNSKGGSQPIDTSPYSPLMHATTREVVVNVTEKMGTGVEIAATVASFADFTGLGNALQSEAHNDPAGALMGMAFIHIPGGGSIAMTEAKSLVSAWTKGTFATRAGSIGYHFNKHGGEVGAKNAWQYMRKAESFSKHLKGATAKDLGDGATRYYKKGHYIDLDKDKKILSYGKQ
jgi:hypothetical protein